jgi:hypothetical protein
MVTQFYSIGESCHSTQPMEAMKNEDFFHEEEQKEAETFPAGYLSTFLKQLPSVHSFIFERF